MPRTSGIRSNAASDAFNRFPPTKFEAKAPALRIMRSKISAPSPGIVNPIRGPSNDARAPSNVVNSVSRIMNVPQMGMRTTKPVKNRRLSRATAGMLKAALLVGQRPQACMLGENVAVEELERFPPRCRSGVGMVRLRPRVIEEATGRVRVCLNLRDDLVLSEFL